LIFSKLANTTASLTDIESHLINVHTFLRTYE
jgi:hypothetical protein